MRNAGVGGVYLVSILRIRAGALAKPVFMNLYLKSIMQYVPIRVRIEMFQI